MKNTIQFTLLLALMSVAAMSCNKDRLQVDPVNEYLSSNYYQNEEQVSAALIGAYDPIGWTMAYGQWISSVMFGEIRSDNANAGGDPSDQDQQGWQELDDFNNTEMNVVLHPLYRRNYIGIARANALLALTELETPAVEVYKAEAKFLRAYYHFELFRHFGPIPVVTEPLDPSDVNLERNTMSEVMSQVVKDCQEAAELLPTIAPSGEEGRATKGAAYALMGKAYLYWADLGGDDVARFDEAAAAFQQVVDLGLYQLVDDMQELYNFGARNTVESVFEIQHNPLWSSDWGWFEGVDGNGIIQLCGIRGLCADHPDYEAGWGFMPISEGLWNHFLEDDTYRRDVAIVSEDELAQDLGRMWGGVAGAFGVSGVAVAFYVHDGEQRVRSQHGRLSDAHDQDHATGQSRSPRRERRRACRGRPPPQTLARQLERQSRAAPTRGRGGSRRRRRRPASGRCTQPRSRRRRHLFRGSDGTPQPAPPASRQVAARRARPPASRRRRLRRALAHLHHPRSPL